MKKNILSCASGQIKKLLVTHTGHKSELSYIELILKEFKARKEGKVYILAGEPGKMRDIRKIFRNYNGYYQMLTDVNNKNPSRWVRDPFTILTFQGSIESSCIMEADDTEIRDVDSDLAEFLVKKKIVNTILLYPNQFGFPFDGGNILAFENIVFIGSNQFDIWLKQISLSNENLSENALAELAKLKFINSLSLSKESEIVVIGEHEKNRGHKLDDSENEIKLFLPSFWFDLGRTRSFSLTSKDVSPSRKELVHIDLFMTVPGTKSIGGKIDIILGEIVLLPSDNHNIEMKSYKDDINSELKKVYDKLKNKFNIVKLPMPILQNQSQNGYYIGFFCNSLVENWHNGKCVWIPQLSASEMNNKDYNSEIIQIEQIVEETWGKVGYKKEEIRWVPYVNWKEDMRGKGAFHCITKELERN